MKNVASNVKSKGAFCNLFTRKRASKDYKRSLQRQVSDEVLKKREIKKRELTQIITDVLISSNCSRIRYLLKRHKKNVTSFCSRVSNNRSVTLKL